MTIDGTKSVTTIPTIRNDVEIIAMRDYDLLSKDPELEPYHRIQFTVTLRTSILGCGLNFIQVLESYTKSCQQKEEVIKFKVFFNLDWLLYQG